MENDEECRSSVGILTEYFHPDESSTAQLLTELAVGLTDDFDVSAVTTYPHYRDEDHPIPKQETHEGVDIHRIPATDFHKERLPLRILNWITFTVSMTWYLLRNAEEDDIYLVLSNPPILPFATFLTAKIRGFDYAYLIYDMYPDMPVGLGYLEGDSVISRLWERAMHAVYRDADRIVVLGDSMEQRLQRKLEGDPRFDDEKITVIPNWEDPEFIQPMNKDENEFAREHGTREKFTLVYSGNIGRYHDVGTAIDGIAKLEERGRTDIQLLIIGEGGRKEFFQRRVDRRGIENVSFLPFQPMERLPESLTCGDASLVAIDKKMEGMCVSSKLYSSLAAGMPVLAVVGSGDEVAQVVRRNDCGAHVDPGDAERVADVLIEWADAPNSVEEMGQNARDCFENNYTKSHAVDRYRALFRDLSVQ